MPTFVLDLAIAIGVDNLDDLLENPVGIFESWPGISLFFLVRAHRAPLLARVQPFVHSR